MDTNLGLVFECLRHHEPGNLAAQKDSLLTIASLCSENDEAKNVFREIGGLGYVLNMLTTVADDDVNGTVLYTLGCVTERNVYSQRRLCSDALFKYLLCQIKAIGASIKMKRSAAFLLTCLVTNNSAGQNLIQSSGCIDGLLNTFNKLVSSSLEDPQKALMFDIVKTLCSCVNNPRHEENQVRCAAVFPNILRLFTRLSDVKVTQMLASFISLTVANNEINQERLGLLGGINVMTSCLRHMVRNLVKQPSQQLVSAISGLVTALGMSSCDHEMNIQTLTDLKVISLLVQVLSLEVVSTEVKLKVILTISVITRSSEISQKQLVDCDGLVLLVQMLMENQGNEEMTKVITSVLQACVGWVSTLGTENILCSKTLHAVSGCQEPTQTIVGHLRAEKMKISRDPMTPVKLEKDLPNDTGFIRFNKEMESHAGSTVQSVTSQDFGKLQKQVGHLEQKFDLVLKYLDTPRCQPSIMTSKDGGKNYQRTFEMQKNLEKMLNVISNKSDENCEIYQQRGRSGDAVKGVDEKEGELLNLMESREDREKKENKSYVCSRDMDGVISQMNVKDFTRSWNGPPSCEQVDGDECHGFSKHCNESEGVGRGDKGGTKGIVSRERSDARREQDKRDFSFNSDKKQLRDEIWVDIRHNSINCKQSDRKSITEADAELFMKPEDKINNVLSRRKQTDGCQVDLTRTNNRKDGRNKQTFGNSNLQNCRLHSQGNTHKSENRLNDEEHYNHFSCSRDKKEDVSKRKKQQVLKKNELQPRHDVRRGNDGLREPECVKGQLCNSQNFSKAAVGSSELISSSQRRLFIAVKEGHKLTIRKLAPRRRMSACRSQKNIATNPGNDRIRDLLSTLKSSTYTAKRRKRQEFSPNEVRSLINEVKRQGKHWNSILWSGNFKKGRTAVDLKDKYRRLVAKNLHQKISAEAK